jgi:predicted dehydrogenase
MKKRIRIGIIGAGWVARERHLPALSTLPEVKLEAIWSHDGQNARKLASEWNISRVAEHWNEIIASETVDAVVVATPPVLHHEVCLSALRSGKHVLCQARLSRNLNQLGGRAHSALARTVSTVCFVVTERRRPRVW